MNKCFFVLNRAFLLLILFLLPLVLDAQEVRITPAVATGGFYLDWGRSYVYNQYEGSHFETNMRYLWPHNESRQLASAKVQWEANGFVGFGVLTSRLSYGAGLAAQTFGLYRYRPYFKYGHFLEQVASTKLSPYQLLKTYDNTIYFADRFSLVDRYEIGMDVRNCTHTNFRMALRYSQERNLFLPDGTLLYDDARLQPMRRHFEAQIRTNTLNLIEFDLIAGYEHHYNAAYVRLLSQYNNHWDISPAWRVSVFGQAGFVSSTAAVSRLFDLSGTWGSGYFFRNTMLTIAPDEFYANTFLHATGRIEARNPLIEIGVMAPTPFAQLGFVCGWLIDVVHWQGYANPEGLVLHAPNHGMAEPVIGLDHLLRVGAFDAGVAVAYRWAPSKAFYHRDELDRNLSVVVSASLTL